MTKLTTIATPPDVDSNTMYMDSNSELLVIPSKGISIDLSNAHLISQAPAMYAMLQECAHSSNKGAWRDNIELLLAKCMGG